MSVAAPPSRPLSADQAEALAAVARSGLTLDLLVGPAGSGKTTVMAALRALWQSEHGQASVVGLAPSAIAAEVLGQQLGITTTNTAKWLHNHMAGRTAFRAGQLVIIDEASLAGTLTLDVISRHAEDAGAKVLLVGDAAQLQAVEAGGAFSWLARQRADAPELSGVHRFSHAWEKAASTELRYGRPVALEAYMRHGRIRGGTTEEINDLAYRAWQADTASGRSSVLIAPTRELVNALNEKARSERILAGEINPRREIKLAGEIRAGVGDQVITRRNDVTLHAGRTGPIRNGDRWEILKLHHDGGVTLRRAGYRRGATLRLPNAYAATHLDLGYAVTGYGAQGLTVDTAHAIVQQGTTREHLYVALTRGRHGNFAYVATDRPDPFHDQSHPSDDPDITAVAILHAVLRHVGAEPSAHDVITAEQERWGGTAQLAAEYETIAAVAQHDRWTALIRSSPLTRLQADTIINSDTFGALTVELRRAEAFRHDVERLLPRLITARDIHDASDIAAVLHERLAAATATPSRPVHSRPRPHLIAGLIPEAGGAMSAPLREALRQRRELIEARVTAVLVRALDQQTPWIVQLGAVPSEPRVRAEWTERARAVAAYRDRYGIESDDVVGPPSVESTQQRARAFVIDTYLLASPPVHALVLPHATRFKPTGIRREI